MDTSLHDLPALFAQLGLPNAPHEINDFIARHRPLAEAQAFCDAVGRDTDEACAGTPLHDDVTLVCIDRT